MTTADRNPLILSYIPVAHYAPRAGVSDMGTEFGILPSLLLEAGSVCNLDGTERLGYFISLS